LWLKREPKIGILPICYSNGYPVALVEIPSDSWKTLLRDWTVSMDYMEVEVGNNLCGLVIKSRFSERCSEVIRAEELATFANTIPYEILKVFTRPFHVF